MTYIKASAAKGTAGFSAIHSISTPTVELRSSLCDTRGVCGAELALTGVRSACKSLQTMARLTEVSDREKSL